MEICVLFIILIFSLQNPILIISQNTTCNSHDLKGLKGFINELDSPINDWWFTNSSSFCCNWVGVTCNSTTGRIVKLELQKKGLSGILSDLISSLDHLKTLNLSHNYIKGPLPVPLFHLSTLEIVDLSSNEFNGVLPVSINLPMLQVFDISDNNLRGFLPLGLCVNSSRIRVVSFALNYFNGSIRLEFGDCGFVERLSVASNYISGIIPDFLLKLPRLRELALEDNELTTINGTGDSVSELVRLDVSTNKISGNVPDFFHWFPSLSYFSAHSNNLTGRIPRSLSNSKSISLLNLRNNSLDGSIDFNCSLMVNLTSLDLGTNKFSGTIPANLSSCVKLKALNLARNKLVGEIPENFRNFESLSYLSLSNCSMSNLSKSLKTLQHCPNLSVLVLTMNFYNEQLPSDDDLQFKSLKALVIANCRLTGSIPSWLNGLTQLQLLDLSFNHLTGSIPAYLGDFKSLFYLDLSNNSLTGEIPKSLTQLQSLISRDISVEEPSPDFPFFKKRDTSRRGLILQYNQIVRFPPQIDLSRNLLTGPIWSEFGKLKKLHVLDLKQNSLSGTIPSSLSNMRSIETLDLSYNSLTGIIPPSLMKLTFLSKFSVAYNNLIGSIPYGGQFSTFTISSFEGNPDLCGNLFLNCQTNQEVLQTPESESNDDSITRFVFSGFGTGFLLAVIFLLGVPRNTKKHTR